MNGRRIKFDQATGIAWLRTALKKSVVRRAIISGVMAGEISGRGGKRGPYTLLGMGETWTAAKCMEDVSECLIEPFR